MNAKAMEPFGKALIAYARGALDAELVIRRDDGREETLPVSLFYRGEADFSPIDRLAIELCHGSVLDVGAGAGPHSAVLQRRGHSVTALDVCADAVEVARRRGIVDVVCGDILSFEGGPFDTLIMMGHGIGMVETIDGLKQFLAHAPSLLAPGGRVLVHSLDVRGTSDAGHLAYQEANRNAGHYIGEIRTQLEFQVSTGPYCGWLQVDAETLREHAESAGWRCDVVLRAEGGDYLAKLTR